MSDKPLGIDRLTMSAAIRALDELFNGTQTGERPHGILIATYPMGQAGIMQTITNGISRHQMAAILRETANAMDKSGGSNADVALGGLKLGAKITDRAYQRLIEQAKSNSVIEKAWAEYRDNVLGPGGYDLQDRETMDEMRVTYFTGAVTSFMHLIGIMLRQNEADVLRSIDDELVAFMKNGGAKH